MSEEKKHHEDHNEPVKIPESDPNAKNENWDKVLDKPKDENSGG